MRVPQIKTLRCDDNNSQTMNDICASGTCQGCPAPTDDCEIAGTFDPLTQQCSTPTVKADGATCDDYNAQTTNGICDSGTCQGCPVPTDDCEVAAGTFDPLTQQCSAPTVKADGTTCDSETKDKCGATLKHRKFHVQDLRIN